MIDKSFAVCKTSEADKELVRNLEMPTAKEQAGCLTNYFWVYLELVKKSDNTIDVEKTMQQFVDYGQPAPEDTKTLGNINVDTEREELGVRTFFWLKNNKDAIRFVFFGDAKEAFN